MFKKAGYLCVFLVTAVLLFGCATFNFDLTPKQRAAWINNVYARQYDIYLDQILKPEIDPISKAGLMKDPSLIKTDMLRAGFTESEKEVLKVKKRIFFEVHPLLMGYNQFIATGQVPPMDLETQIVNLITELLGEESE